VRLAGDIEANGFLEEVTKVHCVVLQDIDTGVVHRFGPSKVEQALKMMMEAELLIFHNGICYDFPVIQKVYPWFRIDWNRVQDTLNLSRVIWPHLSSLDGDRGPKMHEELRAAKRLGSHSLEAWGIRFGYPKLVHEDWTEFSPEMLERCTGDVEITVRLWKHIQEQGLDPRANELEHKVQVIIARQERHGFTFDEASAQALTETLIKRKAVLEAELQDTFPPFYLPDGPIKTYKKPMVVKGVHRSGEHQPIKLVVFNAASTHHIVNRLKFHHGWEPTEFTDKGTPKCDDDVLGKLPYPEAKLLAEYFMVIKRLALVSEGEQAFTKYVRNGRCYGSLIVNGAVTGRGTHKVIANIPRVTTPYGKELRALFTASAGRVQVGVDVSGLELRMLAHFLAAFDGGRYGKIVCEGDVHTANKEAARLETRDQAKTFIYAFLYGGGDIKIGSIANPKAHAGQQRKLGKALKTAFKARTPGLNKLLKQLEKAAKRGFLKGLDGRKIPLRSPHSALNFLLQSSGSLVCKRWMVEVDEELTRRGWHDKVQQLIWYHDEIQFECEPELADELGKLAIECIARAERYFSVRVPLTGEYKVGKNWKECH